MVNHFWHSIIVNGERIKFDQDEYVEALQQALRLAKQCTNFKFESFSAMLPISLIENNAIIVNGKFRIADRDEIVMLLEKTIGLISL